MATPPFITKQTWVEVSYRHVDKLFKDGGFQPGYEPELDSRYVKVVSTREYRAWVKAGFPATIGDPDDTRPRLTLLETKAGLRPRIAGLVAGERQLRDARTDTLLQTLMRQYGAYAGRWEFSDYVWCPLRDLFDEPAVEAAFRRWVELAFDECNTELVGMGTWYRPITPDEAGVWPAIGETECYKFAWHHLKWAIVEADTRMYARQTGFEGMAEGVCWADEAATAAVRLAIEKLAFDRSEAAYEAQQARAAAVNPLAPVVQHVGGSNVVVLANWDGTRH